jgi:hypothetical protein
MKTVAKTFVRDGRRYYVPVTSYSISRDFSAGADLLDRYRQLIHRRWDYPDYMFNARPGGHVAALRRHFQPSDREVSFACIDLKDFFETISDTKVYRALRRVGISHSLAFQMAGESTVAHAGRRILPTGFHQSSLLASLVFDTSLIGSSIRSGWPGCRVTVFNDDIILSGPDLDLLSEAFYGVIDACARSNFRVNHDKTRNPGPTATAFNIIIGNGELRFTDARIERFVQDISRFRDWCAERDVSFHGRLAELYLGYIRSINHLQYLEVWRRVMGTHSDPTLRALREAISGPNRRRVPSPEA